MSQKYAWACDGIEECLELQNCATSEGSKHLRGKRISVFQTLEDGGSLCCLHVHAFHFALEENWAGKFSKRRMRKESVQFRPTEAVSLNKVEHYGKHLKPKNSTSTP